MNIKKKYKKNLVYPFQKFMEMVKIIENPDVMTVIHLLESEESDDGSQSITIKIKIK